MTMDVSEFVNSYVATGQKIDSLWNFYVTVHIAIASLLLLSRGRKINGLIVLVLTVGYLGFSFINWRAKEIEYTLMQALIEAITSMDTQSVVLNNFFDEQNYSDRSMINIGIHVFSIFSIAIVAYFSGHKITTGISSETD